MRAAALLTALFATGCYQAFERSDVPPPAMGTDSAPPNIDAGPPPRTDSGPPPRTDSGLPPLDAGPAITRGVDLLVVVDNSSSMTEEQASLAGELPRLLRILTTGDYDQDGRLDGADDFEPVDVHLGVVTPDMGVGGLTVPTCENPDFGDDGILRSRGEVRRCRGRGPAFLAFGGAASGALLDAARCRTLQGVAGCGFEQPLEAALKALSPAAANSSLRADYEAPRFHRNTFGHGDGENRGFLRNGTVLAVVVLTDEDDCSAADPSLFQLAVSSRFAMTPPNVRCSVHEDETLHPIERFARGLIQLRPSPDRVVFSAIAGIPVDLVPPTGAAPDWDALLSDSPDERMIVRVDPSTGDTLVPSCNVPGRGTAEPPVRLLRTARELARLGGHIAVQSICQDSFVVPLVPILEAL